MFGLLKIHKREIFILLFRISPLGILWVLLSCKDSAYAKFFQRSEQICGYMSKKNIEIIWKPTDDLLRSTQLQKT
jgi:hypothetical protein